MEDLLQIIEDRIKALETEAAALGRRRVRLQHREVGIVRTQTGAAGRRFVPIVYIWDSKLGTILLKRPIL